VNLPRLLSRFRRPEQPVTRHPVEVSFTLAYMDPLGEPRYGLALFKCAVEQVAEVWGVSLSEAAERMRAEKAEQQRLHLHQGCMVIASQVTPLPPTFVADLRGGVPFGDAVAAEAGRRVARGGVDAD
jgi:hypothetical protein